MRNFLARCIIVALLAYQPFLLIRVFAQEEVRQRRTQTEANPQKSVPVQDQWKAPSRETVSSNLPNGPAPEPSIRVALSTDARFATISTAGQLMNAADVATTLVALDVSRVRLEPRLLSPLPSTGDESLVLLQLVGLASRKEAEEKSAEVREAIGKESQIAQATTTNSWGLVIGGRLAREEAEALRERLEDAGLDAAIVPVAATARSGNAANATNATATNRAAPNRSASATIPTGTVRPVGSSSVSSVSRREVVAFAQGSGGSGRSGRLFSSSVPVTFASSDENTPVRFNDKPYRGRIEVFTNTRGALTVVNVLGLEDYVKGVVPNELSAGGFPLIEAHKAQAIAARTYALKNRGQFMSQGFDLLPTTRSQVYRGLASENAFSSRAVDETRGVIATFEGEPINALYTSTCGGRTEDSENIFIEAAGYLRGRECAAEGRAALRPFTITTSRDPAELKKEQNVPLARDVALLSIQNFAELRSKVSDSWLEDDAEVDEVRSWLASVARLARQVAPTVTPEVNHPPGFATALSVAAFGESRGSTLLNNADVDYLLAIRDAADVPQANRADVAYLLREGYLSVLPDATLQSRKPLSRARALRSIARMLEARGLLQLQKATARPTADNALVLRSTKGKDQPVKVSAGTFLFRQIGEQVYPVRSVAMVGGEAVVFHVNAAGEVDYLEVKPAATGAAADRFSPFTNWTAELSLGQAQARLSRYTGRIGSLVDLRVVARGSSRRAVDLEVTGTIETTHVRGGRIRSALGLREQLFVIERKYDDYGRVVGFTFLGRGWGHGVGLCQVGAYGLARQGFTHEQILKAYYAGIELTRLY